jgi:hypothetical protein
MLKKKSKNLVAERLLPSAEIAQRLGLRQQTVAAWPHQTDSPKPARKSVKRGQPHLWRLSEVLEHFRKGFVPVGRMVSPAKSRLARYQADLAELDFGVKSGKLVDRDELGREADQMIISARNKLLALGSKVAAQVAASGSADEIRQILHEEIEQALAELDVGKLSTLAKARELRRQYGH